MTILLMRHAQPVPAGPDHPDQARYLTAEGRSRSTVMGVAVAGERGIAAPDAVLCSPLARAVQTAELFSAALGYDGVIETRNALVTGKRLDALAQELETLGEVVVVVGHTPLMSTLGAALIDASFPSFGQGQVVCVHDGVIAWTESPR